MGLFRIVSNILVVKSVVDLLTEAAQQTAIRAAMKCKAVQEVLLKPSMQKMLDELVTDLVKEQPDDASLENYRI